MTEEDFFHAVVQEALLHKERFSHRLNVVGPRVVQMLALGLGVEVSPDAAQAEWTMLNLYEQKTLIYKWDLLKQRAAFATRTCPLCFAEKMAENMPECEKCFSRRKNVAEKGTR